MVLRDNTPVSERDATPEALVASARLAARFRRLDFVGGASVEERLMLAESCQLQHLGPGESLQTEPLATSVAFLVSGSIRLEGDGISWLDSESPQARAPFQAQRRFSPASAAAGRRLSPLKLINCEATGPAALGTGRPSKR